MTEMLDASGNGAPAVARQADVNRRRSLAMRGNTNAARNKGVASLFMRRRLVRRQDRWALAVYRAYLDGVASDKPGMSEGESRAGELAAACRTCESLILAQLADETTAPADRVALLRELRGFAAVELRALGLLGLERRARPAPGLRELLASRAEGQE